MLFAEATQRNVLTATATMCDVEQELKWWLRGAPDRNGGRNERAKKTKVKQSKRKGQSERKEPAPRFEFWQCSTRRNTVSGSSRQRRSRDRSTVRESSVRRIDSHDRSRSSCSESSESRGSHGDHGLQHGSRHSSHSTQRRSRDSHTPARRRPVRHGSRNISRSRSARRDRSCSARSTDSNTTVDYRSTTHVRSTSDIGDTSRVSRECSTSYSTHESVAAPTDCL
jgi:hypothetical protein